MEQHPVPQNITSYEFRLVGDMTLKQFFQLAGGILAGIILYRLPLIGIVKYPLVLVAVVIGITMAFIPIQGRPFTQWIIAFFRAIYSPTEYVWMPAPAEAETTTTSSTVASKNIFLGFTPFMKTMVSNQPTAPSTAPIDPFPVQPTPATLSTPTPPPLAQPPTDNPVSSPAIPATPPPVTTVPAPAPAPTPTPIPDSSPQTVFSAAPAPVNTPSSNPIPTPIVEKDLVPPPAAPQATITPALQAPTSPNVLSGVVVDSSGKPVEGATVEIIDSTTGIPARALRTNRLGQFQIAIPLPSGSYVVNAEKDGFFFEPTSVQVQNQIIQPIIVKAKAV